MAYDLEQVNGYGTGTLGDVTDPTGQICSYANVASVTEVAVATNALTINAPSLGAYEKFEVGTEILIHVSGCLSGTTAEFLGRYMVCKITGIQTSTLSSAGKILIIDKQITEVLPVEQFAAHILQVITIPQFKTLTITGTGTISPIAYNTANKYGGILPIKCLIELVMSDHGKINLVDMGIPVADKALRYWTLQECTAYNLAVVATISSNGLLDTDKYSGWENHMTMRQLLLNSGDGVCAIWAQKITNTEASANTRIGGTAGGVQFCRGASDSKGYNEAKPANTTNIGGSTIMFVVDDMEGFNPRMIAKYRDSTKALGQGLGRCYIALKNGVLRNDEGLYAFDIISDQQRVMRELNIKDYGSGRHGNITNPTTALNNYATVTKIDGGGKAISYTNMTIGGIADFSESALVMLHVSKHKDNTDMELLGKFIIVKIAHHYTADRILLVDTDVTKCLPADKLAKYDTQIISIFEPNNLTINTNHNATLAWDDTKKIGGLCAIACKNICNIEGGMINVEGKGGGSTYGREGLAFIGNAQMATRLPIGQGHGSVFTLFKTVNGNENSRIGGLGNNRVAPTGMASAQGANSYLSHTSSMGHRDYTGGAGSLGIYGAGGSTGATSIQGSAVAGGEAVAVGSFRGGKNSKNQVGEYAGNGIASKAGAHVYFIADTSNINPYTMCSCGGNGGNGYGWHGSYGKSDYYSPSYGWDSSKGWMDTSPVTVTGSCPGWCFVYVNQIGEIDTTGMVI